ncbi:MAG TPA: citrate lyase holo-[acyl-carrier protein] synthase [Tetragenococcus sp.]|nr:citrate lyase holo-[acyl-carrier protein] synthase [Tetragenococcus sp.]
MSNQVFLGEEISLAQMLQVREERVRLQNELLNKYPHAALLVATMNIPGPIKTSLLLEQVFDQLMTVIKAEVVIEETVERKLKTGPEFYAVSPLSAVDLKQKMVTLEENHACGRLFDLDIHYWQTGNQSISRSDLGLAARRCLVCQNEAKECGRARRHSVQEMQERICELILEKE